MTPRTATLIGLTAILMWSLLAVLTVATGKIPALQLAAMTFAIGALVGSLTWIGRSNAIRALWQPPLAWIIGIGGLFGYHTLYFLALRFGPVGAAFYAWDIGMKHGDIRVLGAASYATPLLSTAFLIMAGFAKPSASIAIAAVLIAGGGLIAAKDMIGNKGTPSS